MPLICGSASNSKQRKRPLYLPFKRVDVADQAVELGDDQHRAVGAGGC